MKIGLTCFMHESNNFIKKTTPLDNFKDPSFGDFLYGDYLIDHFRGGNHELSGSIDEIERQGNTIIPKFCR